MKLKIGLMAIVLTSGLLLTACTNKNSNESITNTETDQIQNQEGKPSGEPGDMGQGGMGGMQMDLEAAADELGVTEEELREALGMNEINETTPGARPSGEPKQMDLASAAETLGVAEDELREALGMNNMPSGGQRPEGSPPEKAE